MTINNIYLFKNFNNYMNRKLKYFKELTDYPTPAFFYENVNFNPADGVSSEIAPYYEEADKCDYVVMTDNNGEIVYRWFIIEADRLNGQQYKLALRRDVLAEKWDKIKISPCFIEKATLASGSPLIINPENVTVNQIKKSQILLKDKTEIPWLVGYYARHESGTSTETGERPLTEIKGEATANLDYDYAFDNEEAYKADFGKYEYEDFNGNFNANTFWRCRFYNYNFFLNTKINDDNFYGKYHWDSGPGDQQGLAVKGNPNYYNISVEFNNHWHDLLEKVRVLGSIHPATTEQTNKFITLKGKIVKVGDKFYKLDYTTGEGSVSYGNASGGVLTSEIVSICDGFVRPQCNIDSRPTVLPTYLFEGRFPKFRLKRTLMTNAQRGVFKYDIPKTRTITYDAPYDMFCIPFGDITIKGVSGIDTSKKLNCAIPGIVSLYDMVSRFGVTAGGGTGILYDIQLLPYCPLPDIMMTGDNEITAYTSSQYSLIKYSQKNEKGEIDDTETTVGIIFNCHKSSFDNVVINQKIEITNPKMQTQCDKYRLCSSDFNSQFEFDAVKNGGVDNFHVDFTYKPFSPYIHVYPKWSQFYGQDFGDPRGLICSTNYSLPIINNSWTQYELQNKNYQQMFNREIQHLDVTHKYDMLEGGINALLGTVSGSVSGGMAGGMIGGPWGAAIGAAVGGTASLAGGIADQFIKQNLYNEAIDFKKDMFNFQLGNIKAMPEGLARVSAFTNNNFIFPILEYYSCTDLEKEIFAKKIKYNGMTVNALGTIQDYLGNSWNYEDITDDGYIKGQLIRLEDLDEETHFANEVANELNKGVYTK